MKKYRIREELFEDNRSDFMPQFEEGGKFHDFYWLPNGKRLPMATKRFKTFEDAMIEIERDKRRSMKPIEEKIHDVD